MPRIRIAYVVALWSAITAGAVAHVISEADATASAAVAVAPIKFASSGHRTDALGNRYQTRAGW